MKKINKLMISGVGVLSTAAVLSVAISCSNDPAQNVNQKDADQKLVEAVTKEKVLEAVKAKVGTIGETTATAAQALIKDVTIDKVEVEVTVVADEENQKVTFTVTKVSKGEATKTKVDDLGGEITGFKVNAAYALDKKDVELVFSNAKHTANAALIKTAIEELFTDVIKQGSATDAIAKVAKEVTIKADTTHMQDDKNYIITFEVVKGVDETKVQFTVTKVAKGLYAATTGVDVLGKDVEIIGFNAKEAAKTLIEGATQTATKGLIQTAVEALFTDKTQTVASATAAVVAREVTIAGGIQVTFTANAKASDTTILEFKVTKLSKDGYDFDLATGTATQVELDAVSGEIAGFRNVGYAAAKTLIDASIAGDIDATKLAITAALQTKLDAANKTAIQAKTDFDALAAGDKNVTLTNNIVVELTISVNTTTDTTLDFTVTKLSKDGYELTAGVNALNDSIANF